MRQRRIGTRELKLRKRIEALNEVGGSRGADSGCARRNLRARSRGNKTVADLVIENCE
jgi:hypothetical protein